MYVFSITLVMLISTKHNYSGGEGDSGGGVVVVVGLVGVASSALTVSPKVNFSD